MSTPVPAGTPVPRSLAASLLLLWLAGLCLRLTVLCVPPVIPLIRESFPLSQANVAALTSLPVLLFCVAAIPGSLMISRWGAGQVLVAGILVTGLASAARAASPDLAMLFGATFVMGIGIAVMQPAFPAIVREWVPGRVALGTAVYSNALLVGEALAASLTIPVVVPLAGGWRGSLATWSGLVLVLGIVLVFAARGAVHGNALANPRWWPDWRDGATWRLGLITGFASTLYFATNSFLPDLVRWHGRPDLLGAALSALNWMQLPASFLMLAFAQRLAGRRVPFIAMALLSFASIPALFLTGGVGVVVFSGVIGFVTAWLLVLTLALAPLTVASEDVPRVSAAMFAIGYFCAVALPILGGFLWDVTGTPWAAFAPVAVYALVAAVLAGGLRFSKA